MIKTETMAERHARRQREFELKKSIEMCRKAGIKEDRIIHSTSELDKWILG